MYAALRGPRTCTPQNRAGVLQEIKRYTLRNSKQMLSALFMAHMSFYL